MPLFSLVRPSFFLLSKPHATLAQTWAAGVFLALVVFAAFPLASQEQLAPADESAAPLLPGDVNLDGRVDEADWNLMCAFFSCEATARDVDLANADLNVDGRVDSLDLTQLHFASGAYRGEVAEYARAGAITRSTANIYMVMLGLGRFTPARYGATLYKVAYLTPNVQGMPSVATGMVAVPSGLAGAAPLLSASHGTETRRVDVPSSPDYSFFTAVDSLFVCSGGYVTVGADYLGLGGSPGMHPFIHASSEATAGIDMLRASKTVCDGLGVSLSGQLFIAGYSQGGHAAMAIHRDLERYHSGEFDIAACAPMAGPYDVSGTMLPTILADERQLSPFVVYLPYTILSWDLAYGILPSLSEAVQAPYDSQLPGLFDMEHTADQIMAALPPVARDVLKPEFLAAVTSDPQHPVNVAARANDVYDWKPVAPVKLYHGKADTTVPYTNAEVAYARMLALGAPVELVNLGDSLNHETAAIPAIYACRIWFDSLLAPQAPRPAKFRVDGKEVGGE